MPMAKFLISHALALPPDWAKRINMLRYRLLRNAASYSSFRRKRFA